MTPLWHSFLCPFSEFLLSCVRLLLPGQTVFDLASDAAMQQVLKANFHRVSAPLTSAPQRSFDLFLILLICASFRVWFATSRSTRDSSWRWSLSVITYDAWENPVHYRLVKHRKMEEVYWHISYVEAAFKLKFVIATLHLQWKFLTLLWPKDVCYALQYI